MPVAKNGIISLGKFKNSNRKMYAGTRMMPDPIPKKPESSPAKIPRNKRAMVISIITCIIYDRGALINFFPK